MFITLSSISYLSSRYNDLLDDKEIRIMSTLLSEIENGINFIYNQEDMSDYEYEGFQRVIKNINNNFDYHICQKIKKLVPREI